MQNGRAESMQIVPFTELWLGPCGAKLRPSQVKLLAGRGNQNKHEIRMWMLYRNVWSINRLCAQGSCKNNMAFYTKTKLPRTGLPSSSFHFLSFDAVHPVHPKADTPWLLRTSAIGPHQILLLHHTCSNLKVPLLSLWLPPGSKKAVLELEWPVYSLEMIHHLQVRWRRVKDLMNENETFRYI